MQQQSAAPWATNSLNFLARATLKGEETPVFNECVMMLQALQAGKLMVVPVKEETTEPPLEDGEPTE